MNTKTKPRRAYHHGGLREALINAARHAIDKAGPETVSLKDLAIKVGVTQSAPYRHFASREAVLQAVAADGFGRFRSTLQAAEMHARSEGAFERAAMAYIRFGQANPGVYRLMFSSREICGAGPDSPLAAASSAAFEDLLRRVKAHASPDRVQAVASWVWCTLHGVVMLNSEGLLHNSRSNGLSIEEIVRELGEAVRSRLKTTPSQRKKH
ncbi:TetR/AcrR family transcriptional regulator [Tardiphaga sp. 866_E4_N2_1]|uniref:TetR/AcrR family transcriptional regulator n=1 Tax=unclassified Tardiphaga TaxID=2631404 RepID=UPI003F27CD55